METIYWKTEEPLVTNSCVMGDYLESINRLDITCVDGTYAEGRGNNGDLYAIYASGGGDEYNHKIEFELLDT